jgi:pyruvate dehydrogenase E2 component (dihydrolipoamide acetyltransferase)
MSQLSMTMLEGRILRWLKQEGDTVKEGEPLLEVETDKVNMEIVSPAPGYLRKILALYGAVFNVGGPLCLFA